MTQPIPNFDTSMREAQLLHSRGEWQDAITQWQFAYGCAPNTSEQGRALRGEASSTFRLGESNGDVETQQAGTALAGAAYDVHDNLLSKPFADEPTPVTERFRQHSESARVHGRMILKLALAGERRTGIIPRVQYKLAADRMDAAVSSIVAVWGVGPAPLDQHEINLAPDKAFAEMFGPDYNEDQLVRVWTERARKLAWRSESPKLPASAGLGRPHQIMAVIKALYRAYAATAANRLVTPEPSRRRTAAVRIATLPGVL